MYGYKVWFNGLKYTNTCSFPMKQKIKNKFGIMICRSKTLIII